jgi:hypothetical protein
MKPKNLATRESQKTTATIQHDLGSDSGDETKIAAMGYQGKGSIASTSTSNNSNFNETPKKKKRIELFHIRVISKHSKN